MRPQHPEHRLPRRPARLRVLLRQARREQEAGRAAQPGVDGQRDAVPDHVGEGWDQGDAVMILGRDNSSIQATPVPSIRRRLVVVVVVVASDLTSCSCLFSPMTMFN